MNIVCTSKLKSEIKNNLVQEYPDATFQFYPSMNEAEEHLHEAEVLITYGEDVARKHIQKAKQLKWIMVLSAGVELLPFKEIKERGIFVTNARGIHSIQMAEYTLWAMLVTARNTKELLANESSNTWNKRMRLNEISGATVGVIGTGAIGCEIARISKTFNMTTIGVNRKGHATDYFDAVYSNDNVMEMIPKCDYLVSVLPSTPDTYHFFTSSHFHAMKESSVFINIGRGDAVDEQALIEALQNEEIHHAVLDVFEQEPLEESHPFWGMSNVTVTPHHSGVSPNYQPRAIEIFKRNFNEYLNGTNDFQNIINPDRGY
ncbi:D-2-hydroxyacid dehydrogenase [Guptibacillus algicola]|uniref:D-2-hydroxyacid dehydrogenase n=1 Tax=Guptibacillus algicola TaxID=225844 RepID=UPI001CD477E0|nr:D-2-hydroxyacid dehydrogenase [Alkalihalobacillus algicola]MCA0989397.1 D-2-hydroxyacid dehydrogenase [Alkalihalobacillus algicola]